MGFHGWRSMSGKTMLFIFLGAAYYLALNALLINEIIDQVRTGPQRSAPARLDSLLQTPDPQDRDASCSGLAKGERAICKADLLADEASTRFRERMREERRERRAAREERRRTPAPSPLVEASSREFAAAAQ